MTIIITTSNAVTILAKLTLKLAEVSKARSEVRDGNFNAIYDAHYCEAKKEILCEDAFKLALDVNRSEVSALTDSLYDDEDCLKLAIKECEKQIQINKALAMIGE